MTVPIDTCDNQQLEFTLISSFIRALCHKLRTPLSVVTNDLAYFASLLPAGETERTAQRAKEISDWLKSISTIPDRIEIAPSTTEELRPFLHDYEIILWEHAKIMIDLKSISLLFEYYYKVLEQLRSLTQPPKVSCSINDHTCTIKIQAVTDAHSSPQHYRSITSYSNLACGYDSPYAPLVDILAQANRWTIDLSVGQALELNLILDTARK